MSDSLTALYLQNPQLAIALRNQQWGQQQLAQATQGGPIRSPWQGIANMVQAAFGGWEEGRSNKAILDAGAQQRQAMADGLAQGNSIIGGAGQGGHSDAPAPPVPAAPQGVASAGGAVPPDDKKALIDNAADAYSVPRNVAYAVNRQESNFGQASPNLMQITAATAANPGYGMAPLAPGDINDPAKNINFGMHYLATRAANAGVKDWNDPAQLAKALQAYNGGGDPNYAANVERWMPGQQPVQVAANGGTASDVGPVPGAGGAPAPSAPPQGSPQAMTAAALSGPPQGAPAPGAQSPMLARALRLQQLAGQEITSPNPQMQRLGSYHMQMAQGLMGMDQFTTTTQGGRMGTLNQRTNQFTPFPPGRTTLLPNGDIWDSATGSIAGHTDPKAGVFNGQGYNPTTMQPIGPALPRPVQFVGNQPADQMTGQPVGPAIPQLTTGAGGVPGYATAPAPGVAPSFAPLPVQAGPAAQVELAKSQGADTGKALADLPQKIGDMGTAAQGALARIDAASANIAAAKQNGLPTGYFTPALAEAAAAAKALGMNTTSLGINPAAVSNIQEARKNLAIVSGEVLRDIMGPGQRQITNKDIGSFIAATPGIETDPAALEKILGWARGQATYNRNMAMDMFGSLKGNGGMLPPTWQAEYVGQNGLGPIFNPLTNNMEQAPGGVAPAQPAAAAPPSAPMPGQDKAAFTVPQNTPRVGSVAEAMKLPPGTLFVTPDGRVKVR